MLLEAYKQVLIIIVAVSILVFLILLIVPQKQLKVRAETPGKKWSEPVGWDSKTIF
jgi:hypothetical protein